jgi:hypothetical protein
MNVSTSGHHRRRWADLLGLAKKNRAAGCMSRLQPAIASVLIVIVV